MTTQTTKGLGAIDVRIRALLGALILWLGAVGSGYAQVRAGDVDSAQTLVDKITAAHKQASDNAVALSEHVRSNETNLNQTLMRTHCDAIGRGLDDALYFTPELARLVRDEDAKARTQRIVRLDTTAKRAFRSLLDKLRGSSVTALELRALALEIDQSVRAAQQELARIMIPKASAPVAAR